MLKPKPLYLSIIASCCFLFACTNPDQSKARHIEQGKQYLTEEKFSKARIELKNALQIDPKSAETYYLLGTLEESQNNWRKAINLYNKAIDIAPAMIEPHIRLGNFFLTLAAASKSSNDSNAEQTYLDKAQDLIDNVLRHDKDNVDAYILNASILAHKGATEAAINQLEKILITAPANKDASLLIARLYERMKMSNKAVQALVSVIQASPDDIDLKLELARLYKSYKQRDKAIEIMQEIIRHESDNPDHRLALAAYYVGNGDHHLAKNVYLDAIKIDQSELKSQLAYIGFIKQNQGLTAAIDYLIKTIETLEGNSTQAFEIQLAALYNESEKHQSAITMLQQIIRRPENQLIANRARKMLAAMHASSGRTQQALQQAELILDESPNDYDALILKGSMLRIQEKYAEAVIAFRSALKLQPDSVEVHHLLAESHLYNRETELAADVFKRALDIAPGNIKSRLLLARTMMKLGKHDSALQLVSHILENESSNLPGLVLKTDILMSQGKTAEVISLIEHIKLVAPDSAEGWFRMGRIYKSLNKKMDARQEFIIAHTKSPDSVDLLAELTDIEIELGEIRSTKSRLINILSEQPEHPAAHKFLGMAYLAENNTKEALNEFNLHLNHSPDDIATYTQIANIHYLMRDIKQAASYYSKARELAPNNVDVLTGLAHIRSIENNHDEAIALYEQILAAQPDNAVATNNLAMILAVNKSDTASLLQAKTLIDNSPQKQHPALLDTLGWIYYLLDDHGNALSALKQAIALSPAIPTFHYHIAMVYIKTANHDTARKHLEAALKLGNFPERIAATRELDKLKS